MSRRLLPVRIVAALGVVAAGVLAVQQPASAHVTVEATRAVQGGYTKVTFRVPNEKDKAETVKVEVTLPTDAPVASASIRPTQGWTATVDRAKLAQPITTDDGTITEGVSKITWTASAGNGVKPGEFQEFAVSMGPLPKTDQIAFKTLQTYSDGEIVRWIEVPAAGAEEPANPAPVLKLAAEDAAADEAKPAAVASTGKSDDDDRVDPYGIAGLALGVVALVIGLLAYRRAAQPR